MRGQLGLGLLVLVAACEREPRATDWTHPEVLVRAIGLPHDIECAISNGHVACRGDGSDSVLGRGKRFEQWTTIEGIDDARTIVLEPLGGFACVLRATGAVVCWGDDVTGALGRGREAVGAFWPDPAPVQGLSPVVAVTAGAAHVCASTNDGVVSCWGGNLDHEVNAGDDRIVAVPTKIEGAPPLHGLVAKLSLTCGLDSSRGVWCWGSPIPDGHGGFAKTARPRDLGARADVLSTTEDETDVCAMSRSGHRVACWSVVADAPPNR